MFSPPRAAEMNGVERMIRLGMELGSLHSSQDPLEHFGFLVKVQEANSPSGMLQPCLEKFAELGYLTEHGWPTVVLQDDRKREIYGAIEAQLMSYRDYGYIEQRIAGPGGVYEKLSKWSAT